MAITANRGGVTASYWYESGIKCEAEILESELKIRFELDSKGGGKTQVQIDVERKSFQELLELMLECDFEYTVNAFGKSLVARQRSAAV
jgi:hypothetical protein